MNKKFTKLIAALALLVFMTPTVAGWGQTDYSTMYTSNVELLTTNGSNATSVTIKVNSTDNGYSAIKLGGKNASGYAYITVPANTTTLHIHCAGWNNDGVDRTLNLTTTASGVTISSSGSMSLTNDSNISGSATTFTLAQPTYASTYYYASFSLTGVNEATTIKLQTSSKRAVYWGINAVTSGGGNTPSITISGEEISNNAASFVWNSFDNNVEYTASVAYNNMDAPSASEVAVGVYTDANCGTSFTGDYFGASFASNSVETINYTFYGDNQTASPRTVYMRVETYNAEGTDWVPCNVIAVTQAGKPTYTVTYVANGGIGTMTDSNSPYFEDDEVTLLDNTFEAPAHMEWASWSVKDASNNDVTVSNGKFTMPARNVTVTAQWTPITHTFNTAVNPDNSGTVVAKDGNNETVASGSAVAETAQLTLTATPSENYRFTSWSVSGAGSTVTPNNASSTTFTMGTADATATANFTRIYTITCATGLTNGSISANPVTAAAGETVGITASPADGYILSTITVTKDGGGNIDAADITITTNHAEFDMPADNVTVSATFTEVYHVTYNANEAESGTVPTDNTNYTSANHTVTVKGNTGNLARAGYDFGGWNTQADGNGTNYSANETFDITSNTTLYAKWEPGTYTVAVSSVDNVTITARYGENSIAEGSNAGVLIGTEVSLCADGLDSGKAIVWDVYKTGATTTKVTVTDNKFVVPAYGVTISGTVGDLFEKYTSESIVEGDYIIYYTNAMNNTVNSNRLGLTTVTIVNDQIIASDPTDYVWHIAADGNYWTIKNTSNNSSKYVYATGSTTGVNLRDAVGEDDKALWSFTRSTSTYLITNKYNNSNNADYKNLVNGGSYFACYKNQTKESTLYKKVNSYQLDVASVENGTIVASVSGLSDIAGGANANVRSGATVTLIATPDDDYVNNPWTVYKTGDPETTVTVENNQFTMPEYAVTVTTSFRSVETVTLTYSENGVVSSSSVAEGEITLKNASEITVPTGYAFVGWSASPSDFSAIYNGTYMLSGNTTLYAVFSIDMPTEFSFEINTSDFITGGYDGNNNEKTTVAEAVTGETLSVKWRSNQVMQINSAMQWQKDNGYIYNSTDLGTVKSVVVTSTAGTFTTYYGTSAQPSSGVAGVGKGYFKTSVGSATGTTSKVTVTFAKNTPHYFTRVFGNETPAADIEINGPSIIPSGSTLNMGDHALTNGTGSLIIEDGGQLIASNWVTATMKKNITAYTSADDGWNLISSPVNTNLTAAGIGLITESTYDLYYLNEEFSKWINFKAHEGNMNPGFSIQPSKGYLYSNAANTTLSFSGNLQPNIVNGCEINLTKVGEGWNLVGNPFPFNAYVNKSYYVINGRTVEVYEGSDPVSACTGIIVKATAGNEKVTFRRTAFTDGAVNHGNLQMTLSQQVTTRGNASNVTLDNAIVSFNVGDELEKFYFGEQNANLYIPQGNEEYAIVSSEAQGEMPVSFRANENGQYTLTVNAENVEMNYLHLIDNMTGADIDLLATPSYTFNAKTTDYESRFRLVFAANNEDVSSTSSETFSFFSNDNWVISNEGEATLQVIDVTGRILSSETVNGSVSKNINAPAGVYVLRLINGDSVKTQKIVVR